MTLPFFFISEYHTSQKEIVLDEDTSRHIVQVLRMKEGEKLNLTDGKGNLISAEISEAHKKHCSAHIQHTAFKTHPSRHVTIAISLLKNTNRLEWFLEKATEIGVSEIVPLLCARTEKQKFRLERMKQICISAMLQSQQTWLPALAEPVSYKDYLRSVETRHNISKFIAHCDDASERRNLSAFNLLSHCTIVIGPEGDFTPDEIQLAIKNDFSPVTLGKTRLRTETAGIVAATLLSRI